MDSLPTHYILIDHENVHTLDFGEIADLPAKVFVFLGQNMTKLPIEDVQRLLRHRGQVELISVSGQGKNALDFHIAYYAGRISVEEPRAFIHIISKDAGFDPLLVHMKSRKVRSRRSVEVPNLAAMMKMESPPTVPIEDRLERVTQHLIKIAKTRPRKRATLASNLATFFGNKLTEEEVAGLIAALVKAGKLLIDEKDAVTYRL